MSFRIWENLPEQYKASYDPNEMFTLWRADGIGKEVTGMLCELSGIDPEEAVYSSLFIKYPNFKTIVKRHLQSNYQSPFVSLTPDLEIAGRFSKNSSETIYEIAIPAFKIVADPPSKNGVVEEFLAIGNIEPSNISAVLDPQVTPSEATPENWKRIT